MDNLMFITYLASIIDNVRIVLSLSVLIFGIVAVLHAVNNKRWKMYFVVAMFIAMVTALIPSSKGLLVMFAVTPTVNMIEESVKDGGKLNRVNNIADKYLEKLEKDLDSQRLSND